MLRKIGAAAAAAMIAGTAWAQDQAPGEDAVRAFVDEMVASARQAVSAGDAQAMTAWLEGHLADGAQIAAAGVVSFRGGPVVNYQTSFDGDDLTRLAGIMGKLAVEDYAIEADVRDVRQLPNGEASAAVVFHEAGAIAARGDGAEAARAVFDSSSTCDLRLSGSGEALAIEAASCMSSTTM
jgi:hypothetical protein